MNRSSLETVSALVVSLVLIATMIYSVVFDEEDHEHSRMKPPQAYSLNLQFQTDSNDRGK